MAVSSVGQQAKCALLNSTPLMDFCCWCHQYSELQLCYLRWMFETSVKSNPNMLLRGNHCVVCTEWHRFHGLLYIELHHSPSFRPVCVYTWKWFEIFVLFWILKCNYNMWMWFCSHKCHVCESDLFTFAVNVMLCVWKMIRSQFTVCIPCRDFFQRYMPASSNRGTRTCFLCFLLV